MELELWAELSVAISAVESQVTFRPRDTHRTAWIVRVHLWAALHDRPTCWACEERSWPARVRPAALPDQSTMSVRMRRGDVEPFLKRLGRQRAGTPAGARVTGVLAPGGGGGGLVELIDGKPLELPNHTADPDARWGRGVSRTSVGYKLHMIRSGGPMPDDVVVTPLNVCEKRMAARMVKRGGGGGGTIIRSAGGSAAARRR